MISKTLLYGSTLNQNRPPVNKTGNHMVELSGKYNGVKGTATSFLLDEDILSKHSLLIGGTGCGKTTLFYHMISQVKQKMTQDDVMIIFDSKGDFYSKFAAPGDIVIGNSPQYYQTSERWNIFKEILADGWDEERFNINAQEICKAFFKERADKNQTNAFFPNAARDLLAALLVSFIRAAKEDEPPKAKSSIASEYFYNDKLIEYLNGHNSLEIVETLSHFAENTSVISYIEEEGQQTQGVLSELYSVVRDLFIGVFAGHGKFSIRNFVRNKGGRTLFIEYDLSIGNVLSPMYSLLFDLALKEALGRQQLVDTKNEKELNKKQFQGNVYLFCDEFKLLPRLEHIADGVNFGRGLGVKIFAGLQSIEQLYEIYEQEKGRNIAAGFSSIYAFRANDTPTRRFVTELFGKNLLLEQYITLDKKIVEEKRDGYTVEDWDMTELGVGEAVVGLPFAKPFKFYFDTYK